MVVVARAQLLPRMGTMAHSWQSSHHAFLGRNREPPPSLTKDGFVRASPEEDALLHFIRGRPAWNAALRPWRGRNKHENTCQVGIGRFLLIRGCLVSFKTEIVLYKYYFEFLLCFNFFSSFFFFFNLCDLIIWLSMI